MVRPLEIWAQLKALRWLKGHDPRLASVELAWMFSAKLTFARLTLLSLPGVLFSYRGEFSFHFLV